MRKSALDVLLPRTRRGILATLFMSKSGGLYLADLARRLGVPPSSLQRELAALVGESILTRRKDGNRIVFEPNEECPFLPELRGLIIKTVGLADVLRDALQPLAEKIDLAFVYGSMARSEEHSRSDIDLIVVGRSSPREVSSALAVAREQLARELNATVYRSDEFRRKARESRGFLRNVLEQRMVFVVGNPRGLAAVSEQK